MSAIVDAAQALAGLLRGAEDGDLSMPYDAEVTNYVDARHPAAGRAQGQIMLMVHTLDELTEWATWLDEPIDDTAAPHEGKVHCHVFGMVGPVPVRVTTLVPVADEVSA